MKIIDITNFLEEVAPLSFQEGYDNCGLIVGDFDTEVKGILTTLDCVESIVDEAIEKNCNLIIAHHPIVFSGLKKFNNKNYIERTVIKAIKNDIAIYAIHTNLDNVSNGVNRMICDKVGVLAPKILSLKSTTDSHGDIGAGMYGELDKEYEAEEFFRFLKSSLELKTIKVTSFLDKKIKRVAVCGGAGSFLLNDAIKEHADVFITSDYKYHQFFDAENHIIIADIGHYESEKFTKELIHKFLSEKFCNIAILVSQVDTNPVRYI